MEGLAAGIKRRLDDLGVRHLVSVANGESAPLYFLCREDPGFTVIDACREGEAVGISAGIHLGGYRPLLSMENFGLFECLDSLRALPIDMGFPLLMLVGYTARPGPGSMEALEARLGNAATQAGLAGRWTEPFLDLAGIPHFILESPADAGLVAEAAALSDERRGPVALLAERT
jgi:sulfopyruvate decarboxylase subunit alpha